MEEQSIHPEPRGPRATLYLKDQAVGEVVIIRTGPSWSHGLFTPNDRFKTFAPLFGQWSLMMHADGKDELSPAAGEALRRLEFEIDRLHARLHWPHSEQWVCCTQVNIDGTLIEWKRGS